MKVQLRMIAQGKMLARPAIVTDLHEIAKLGIGHIEHGLGRGLRPPVGEQVGHQRRVVLFAVGMRGHRVNQPGRRVVAHQQFGAEQLARLGARQLELLGDVLGLLAIDDPHLIAVQAGRQRIGLDRQQVVQAPTGLGQEGDTQVQGQPTQFAVKGLFARGQGALLFGLEQRLAGTAVLHQEGIGQQLDQLGKGQRILVALPAMRREARRQEVLVEGIAQQMKHRVGQRQASQRLAREIPIANPNLGSIAGGRKPTAVHDHVLRREKQVQRNARSYSSCKPCFRPEAT